MSHPPQEPRWATDEGIFLKMLGYLAKRQTRRWGTDEPLKTMVHDSDEGVHDILRWAPDEG